MVDCLWGLVDHMALARATSVVAPRHYYLMAGALSSWDGVQHLSRFQAWRGSGNANRGMLARPDRSMLTSLRQTFLEGVTVQQSYNGQTPASLYLLNGRSQTWKRNDQRRGQLGITTVYGAEFHRGKKVWF